MEDLSNEDYVNSQWQDGVAVVIPAIPFLGNNFISSFVAGIMTHIMTSLPNLLRHWRSLPDSYRAKSCDFGLPPSE